jgi:hypothetical protein
MVNDVKNNYITPTSQNLFSTNDVINHLDKAMRTKIIPLINSAREEYWVTLFDQPVTGAASYTLPQRSSGAMLRDIVFVDPQGNEIELTRLSPVQIKSTFPFGYQLPLYTFGYYLQNDQVILYPQQAVNATAYTLRMKYLRRPNALTASENCGQVTGINTGTGVISLSNNGVNGDWSTATTFDVIQNFPQFSSLQDGMAITAIDNTLNTITVTTIPTGLAVGDWVCPTLMSCIPQIPYEAYDLLIAAGATRLARALGDSQGEQLAEKSYDDFSKDFIKLIDPRVQGGRKIITNRNSPFRYGVLGNAFLR